MNNVRKYLFIDFSCIYYIIFNSRFATDINPQTNQKPVYPVIFILRPICNSGGDDIPSNYRINPVTDFRGDRFGGRNNTILFRRRTIPSSMCQLCSSIYCRIVFSIIYKIFYNNKEVPVGNLLILFNKHRIINILISIAQPSGFPWLRLPPPKF